MKDQNVTNQPPDIEKITRKEALKKAGKYAAFTASAMITILVPKTSQAVSGAPQSLPEW